MALTLLEEPAPHRAVVALLSILPPAALVVQEAVNPE